MSIVIIGIVAFLLYLLQLTVFQHFWDKKLHIQIQFENLALQEGTQGWLTETIENRKRLPMPMLRVKFQCPRELKFDDSKESTVTDFYYRNEIFTVKPYQRVVRRLRFTAAKRGYYSLQGVDLVGSDLFLSQYMVKQEKAETVCLVYPRPLNREQILPAIRQLQGELLGRRQSVEDPFEYRGIREYQSFDEMKQINWKATAKTGALKVNERGYTTRQGIRIFLNLRDDSVLRHEEDVENAIRLCVSLSMELLEAGNRVAVYANACDCLSGELLEIKASTGSAHMRTILGGLARLSTTKCELDFETAFHRLLHDEKREFLTVFISTPGAKGFAETVRDYIRTGKECRWFYLYSDRKAAELPPDLERYVWKIYGEGA